MIVSVECSVKDHIETFFEYLKKRATDKAHTKDADVIADFVDRFIVIEMKRLATKDETFNTDIEIPDSLLLDPLKEAKLKMDKIFEDFFKNKGVTAPSSALEKPPITAEQFEKSLSPATAKPRNGNGHKSLKQRSLLDPERDDIRAEFLSLNGQIDEDACVRLKANKMPKEVAIFQVTGFMTHLHMKVAAGELKVRDLDAYLNFLQGHRDMWARYNSPKYQALRTAAAAKAAA
jgi:hypothetical protein